MDLEVSQKDMAYLLNLTTRQVRNLEEDGLPYRAQGNRKYYPVREAFAWYLERERERLSSGSGAENALKLRKMEADAQLKEMEVQRQQNETISIDDMELMMEQPLATLRVRVLGLPARVAALLPIPPSESAPIIEEAVAEFLTEVSVGDPFAEIAE